MGLRSLFLSKWAFRHGLLVGWQHNLLSKPGRAWEWKAHYKWLQWDNRCELGHMITAAIVQPFAETPECVSVRREWMSEIHSTEERSLWALSSFPWRGIRHGGKSQVKTQGRVLKIYSFPTNVLFIMYFCFKVGINWKKKIWFKSKFVYSSKRVNLKECETSTVSFWSQLCSFNNQKFLSGPTEKLHFSV